MEKLSQYLSSPPLINELLMKLITRLAHYPQPLIRSFLLNHHLIFKPGTPNLIHVRLNTYAIKEHFESLLTKFGLRPCTIVQGI